MIFISAATEETDITAEDLPQHAEHLAHVRAQRLEEKKMMTIVREVTLNTVLVIVLITMAYGRVVLFFSPSLPKNISK